MTLRPKGSDYYIEVVFESTDVFPLFPFPRFLETHPVHGKSRRRRRRIGYIFGYFVMKVRQRKGKVKEIEKECK